MSSGDKASPFKSNFSYKLVQYARNKPKRCLFYKIICTQGINLLFARQTVIRSSIDKNCISLFKNGFVQDCDGMKLLESFVETKRVGRGVKARYESLSQNLSSQEAVSHSAAVASGWQGHGEPTNDGWPGQTASAGLSSSSDAAGLLWHIQSNMIICSYYILFNSTYIQYSNT